MKGVYRVKDLTKKYDKKEIFKGLNLEIKNDEITVILGKSGCGKTTLMKILSGLDKDITGEIRFYNEKNIETSIKYGFVFQESRLLPWLNVKENICIHGKKIDVDSYLDMVGLRDYKNSYPEELSGGMAQRVSLIRALSYQPDTLFMDEPFSALDYFTRRQLQSELLKIYEKTKIGIIFVTHNLEEAIALAHRVLVIKDGNILEFKIEKEFPRKLEDIELIKLKSEIINLIEN